MDDKRCDKNTVAAQQTGASKIRAWAKLLSAIAIIWLFAFIVGPWGEKHIPVFKDIVKVVEAQDINANAYFYTEIEASYNAEQYLRSSIRFAGHRDSEFNLTFMSGVALCIIILVLGFRFLPDN